MGHPKCIAGVFETISKDDIIKITDAAIYLYQGDATLITSSGSSTAVWLTVNAPALHSQQRHYFEMLRLWPTLKHTWVH